MNILQEYNFPIFEVSRRAVMPLIDVEMLKFNGLLLTGSYYYFSPMLFFSIEFTYVFLVCHTLVENNNKNDEF